jgi:hypothetical protein
LPLALTIVPLFSTGWDVMGTGELAGNDRRPPCFRTRRRAGEKGR